MSIIVTTDISCDVRGCGAWVDGAVGMRIRAREARDNASRYGFVRRKMADGTMVDLCERHADREALVDA